MPRNQKNVHVLRHEAGSEGRIEGLRVGDGYDGERERHVEVSVVKKNLSTLRIVARVTFKLDSTKQRGSVASSHRFETSSVKLEMSSRDIGKVRDIVRR